MNANSLRCLSEEVLLELLSGLQCMVQIKKGQSMKLKHYCSLCLEFCWDAELSPRLTNDLLGKGKNGLFIPPVAVGCGKIRKKFSLRLFSLSYGCKKKSMMVGQSFAKEVKFPVLDA